MAKTRDPNSYAQIVRDSRAAGMTLAEARAHAAKILGERDRVEVDPKTGKGRRAPAGPSLVESMKRKPERRRKD